jgi:hypothetical protein
MSHRLQVLIPEGLNARLEKAAQRSRVPKGEWVRKALEESLRRANDNPGAQDPVLRLAALNGPVSEIDRMLTEIEAGRS